MYDENKAAEAATCLLIKAGAEGMSQRRLLALMYLAERDAIRSRGVPMTGDEFMLTEHGPVMKQTYSRIMDGPDGTDGAQEWALRIEWLAADREPAMVADAGTAYAKRRTAAPPEAAHLTPRSPQPPARWPGGTPMDDMPADPPPDEWLGRDEGMPYFTTFSIGIYKTLSRVWLQHGGRDEDDLIQHMHELPESSTVAAGDDLPISTILKCSGYTQREIKEFLEFYEEMDAMDRHRWAEDGHL